MSEAIDKLRPDRDLQCYFFRPSAIAALSNCSASGFTVSGSWRQQFDWAVIEWHRNNVFEHPWLRTLPDGDLNGLTLSYRESRTNCLLMDSTLFPTVDWPFLRIWADNGSGEQLYRVRPRDYATATQGSSVAAQATFTLQGALVPGDVVELAWLNENYFQTIQAGDTIAAVVQRLSDDINALSGAVSSQYSAADGTITLTHLTAGEEGNNLGIIANVSGVQTEQWTPTSQTMSGGASPSEWQVDLDFANLLDENGASVPTSNVRKMRWTYAAAMQPGAYSRTEFEVTISNWTVTGTNRAYSVAALMSRRFEDDGNLSYSGTWNPESGNFSGGAIRKTNQVGAAVTVNYNSQVPHRLFLGTRHLEEAGIISVTVDSDPAQAFDLYIPAEDFLARLDLGLRTAGSHTVTATLTGANAASSDNTFYFDYVEEAIESTSVSAQPARPNETLATDWDTDHSLALAPERVAWNLQMLGFTGRANHYAGAILFYELTNPDNIYASGTVTFQGTPVFSQNVQVNIDGTVYNRLTLSTDTNESIAKAFEFLINNCSTGVRAAASGNVLTITARLLGTAGNALTLSASPTSGAFQAVASGTNLTGGVDGNWLTDTAAFPRMNRAARDWHRAYFAALATHGIEAVAAFSTELSHADPSSAAGMAQRYPDGGPVLVNTPAVQTNFSTTSLDFWKQAYLEMAQMQSEALVTPYLQFGEVQWWYFPGPSGMTFYDNYTTTEFQNQYGRAMHVFTSNDESPDPFPEEKAFLPGLIGSFTSAIRGFVSATYPLTKFEVLYPHDVNDHVLTRAVNYPDSDWTTANLDVLKTENFTYTGSRNLNKAVESIQFPQTKGFAVAESAHLVGVFNASEPWDWERRLSRAEGVEHVVLWAFDQFSLIGYPLPLHEGIRRSFFLGGR